jgi:membrane-associated protease RseP (regulator of RpoE activity)
MPTGNSRLLVHVCLFIVTCFTATLAGIQWLNRDPFELTDLALGIPYAVSIMVFLCAHEFGHYLAARAHHVDSTLPYFLPFPSFLGIAPFGTLGAVIRIRSHIATRASLLDIAAFGPICGFLVSVVLLYVGFVTLPAKEYLYQIHPEYLKMDHIPTGGLTFGKSLLYILLERVASSPDAFIPPMSEVYHYPLLCAGWFGLFVTTLNLIPVGQLDGGHIVAALFPSAEKHIARMALLVLVVLGTLGAIPLLGYDFSFGWLGWLVWAIILSFMLFRMPGQSTSQRLEPEMTSWRRVTGWICIGIFIVTFTPVPIFI